MYKASIFWYSMLTGDHWEFQLWNATWHDSQELDIVQWVKEKTYIPQLSRGKCHGVCEYYKPYSLIVSVGQLVRSALIGVHRRKIDQKCPPPPTHTHTHAPQTPKHNFNGQPTTILLWFGLLLPYSVRSVEILGKSYDQPKIGNLNDNSISFWI
jgi:hypothetical protein